MTAKTKVEELNAEYQTLINKMGESICEHVLFIMKKDPHIKSLSFVHNYESHWNDDGYSTMGVNAEIGNICYVDDMGVEETVNFDECWTYKRETKDFTKRVGTHPAYPIIEEFINFISNVPELMLENFFDDGEVIFNSDGGISYQEYDNY